LRGKFQAAVLPSVDTPACIEVPQRVQASVFGRHNRLAIFIIESRLALLVENWDRHASRDLSGCQPPYDYVGMVFDLASSGGETQSQLALRAS
jgi:hypothetical protein